MHTHDDHAHRDHHHDHDHDHGHTHRSGLRGWLQSTFAHSHDIHEKVDDVMESNDRGFWATRWALVSLAITTMIQVIVVWFSGSTALFADTVHNLGDGANSIPLLIAFALAKRGQSRQFTYGFGRVEDLAGVVIVLSIAISAAVAGWESIRKLLDPQEISHVWWVAAAAVVGFIGNEAVAMLQIRTGRQIGSAALIADGQHARIDGFTSLAVLIGVAGVLVGIPILDPIVGLLITMAILFILKDAGRSIFRRLLDGIEPEILAGIEHIPTHVAGVRGVEDVRARWLGHRVQAELNVLVDADLSVQEGNTIAANVQSALQSNLPGFGHAAVSIIAAPEPGTSGTTASAGSP